MSGSASGGQEAGSGGGIGAFIEDLASRFGGHGEEQRDIGPMQHRPGPEDERAAEAFSDEKALLLVRAMITAAHSDGTISPDERARILQQLDDSGADSEDKRRVEQELENPKSLDDLIGQVGDEETAQEFDIASHAAVDREIGAKRT